MEFEEMIKTCSEDKLYFIVDECGAFTWRMNHELSHGRIEDPKGEVAKDIQNVRELQQKAVAETKRFGVPEFDVKQPSEDYWKWYRHWDSWKKGLTNEEWDIVNSKLQKEESLEGHLPTKKWNE